MILIPEFEYDIDEVLAVCQKRYDGGQKFTIIVVAEGAKQRGGEMVVRERVDTSPDPLRLGGVGHVLGAQIKEHFGGEVRTTVLGHVQRGGSPTAFDRVLSTGFGAKAAQLVAEGTFGRMVALQKNAMTHVGLETVANKTKTVPADSPLLAAARAVGTSFG